MWKQFYFKQFSLGYVCILNVKTVLFLAILLSICTQFSAIWTTDSTLSGTTTLGESGPGSNGNEWVLCILPSTSIRGTSTSDYFVPYTVYSLGEGLTPL